MLSRATGHSRRCSRLPRSGIIDGCSSQYAFVGRDGRFDGDGSPRSSSEVASANFNGPVNIGSNGRRRSRSAAFGRNPSMPSRKFLPHHRHEFSCSWCHPSHDIHRRCSSSSATATEQITSVLPAAPEFLADATLWGGTGVLLTNFHAHLHLPYWACISLTNVCIRASMIPIAVRGAKTSVRFGRISPEVQYLITSFTNDMRALRARGVWSREGSFAARQTLRGQGRVINLTLQTLRGLFRLNKVNLFDIFKSPTLQIPIFWYFALDLRKIIEGFDPALAQQLVDSSFFWITDLTEPDPWYGLPLFTGALLYLNVEIAVGKQALSGETSSKSNIAKFLKDAFQTLAIFMPCFMAQQPSGVQLYLATSMIFTLLQSNAMRNNAVRKAVGLPPMNATPRGMAEGEYVKDFFEKMAERQAAKSRGGFVLGEGVSVMGAQISVPRFGKKKKSSIVVEEKEEAEVGESQMVKVELVDYTLKTGLLVFPDAFKLTLVPFLPGMAEPVFHAPHDTATPVQSEDQMTMPEIPFSVIEAANHGERAAEVKMAPRKVLERRKAKKKKIEGPINVKNLKSKRNKKKGNQRK